ncbi:MAG: 2-dehydropantoate 2-reductase [Rhodospirillaceae bacterium]|nr:2-dehydropantoate 2-reductase [Rhodospirillaceae bacterium]|tara:strand:- start:2539 stop:3459 length:921 start_codon:yes stop_codon:yes gene_type:complete
MKIGIIGAGGVGGFFGAKLAKSGHDVTFIQRGPHLQAMQRNGLKVESESGDIELPTVLATDDPRRVGLVDVVLVTVKSGQTDEAIALIKPMMGQNTAVITLQNGVENECRLMAKLGESSVLGGVAYILSLIKSPGVIQQTGPMARLEFGELDGTRSRRALNFLEVCENASIEATLSDNIQQNIWKKFVFLCPHNGMTSLTRSSIGKIRDDRDCRSLLEGAVHELLLLAEAKGISVGLNGTSEVMKMYDSMPHAMTSSMHYDVLHKKPLELDWLNGAVVRLGKEVGISTPVNSFIYAALKLLKDGAV